MEYAYIVGIVGFIAILILLAMGAHVSVAIGVPALIGLFFIMGIPATMEVISSQIFGLATDYSFTAVPLFLLMGYVAMVSGVVASAFDAASLWLNKIPGGLAVAACAASVPIGATMGSGVPATAALSQIAIPEMFKHKYNKGLATGTIAATSTIAVLIPPSIMMVVYAIYTQVSLGKMLLAGYIPGMMSVLIYIVYIIIRVKLNPSLAPESNFDHVTWGQRFRSLKGIWGVAILFLVLFFGIYSGLFTATEAAALAAFTAFILLFVNGKFNGPILKKGFMETIQTTTVLFVLLVASVFFVVFIDATGLPQEVSKVIVAANLPIWAFLGIIMLLYLFLGCFLPSIASLLLTIPILLPVLNGMDVNLIWFGILFVKMTEVGAITPPFGMSCFIVKSVLGDQVTLGEVFRGIVPFIFLELATLLILMFFPAISLWLPQTMWAQ
jgi:C4-dicarboxylate transporter, DctM subunit